jgi:hypothetical protein
VVEKFANAWTKDILHFEHWTTSRIKSSHTFIKSHLLGPQHSFADFIKIILNALEAQCHKISLLYHQQKITSLQKIGKIFHNCHGRITHFALQRAQNNLMEIAKLEKTSTCNGFQKERTGIPCKHRIAELVELGQQVEPKEFHPQWHIKVCYPFIFPSFFFFRLGLGVVGSEWG